MRLNISITTSNDAPDVAVERLRVEQLHVAADEREREDKSKRIRELFDNPLMPSIICHFSQVLSRVGTAVVTAVGNASSANEDLAAARASVTDVLAENERLKQMVEELLSQEPAARAARTDT